MDYIPGPPLRDLSRELKTYADGRWGIHEYSRWPQMIDESMPHFVCIPTSPGNYVRGILFASLTAEEHWREDQGSGIPEYGYVMRPVMVDLGDAVRAIEREFASLKFEKPSHRRWGDRLHRIISDCMQRLERLPALKTVAIAWAAHVQRLTLELAGLVVYFREAVPRLEGAQDHTRHVLKMALGGFTRDPRILQAYYRAGLPVWFIRPLDRVTRVCKVVDIVEWPYYLSDVQTSRTLVQHAPTATLIVDPKSYASVVESVYRHLCGQSLAAFSMPDHTGPVAKRPRLDLSSPVTPGDRGGERLAAKVTSDSKEGQGTKRRARRGRRKQVNAQVHLPAVPATGSSIAEETHAAPELEHGEIEVDMAPSGPIHLLSWVEQRMTDVFAGAQPALMWLGVAFGEVTPVWHKALGADESGFVNIP